MITLYHCAHARSMRALWMLEELGLPYALETMPFPPRVFHKPFKEVNPLGTIPYLIDGETRMTESVGICHYLGVKYGARQGQADLVVAPDEKDFGAYLNWMFYADATLTFPQTVVLRYTQLEPPERRLPQAADDYRAFFYGRLRLAATALEHAEYLCADRFTAADIAVGYALHLAVRLDLDGDFPGHVRAYYERLAARPAFERSSHGELI